MRKEIIEIFKILSKKQKNKILKLQFFIAFAAVIEVLSVSMMPLFLYVATNKNILQSNKKIQYLYNYFELQSHDSLIIVFALFSFFVILIGNGISLYLTYKLTYFSAEIGHDLGTSLFKHYLQKPYIYHTLNSSSKLLNNIHIEIMRFFSGVISPLLNLNAKLFVSVLFLGNLLYHNYKVTIILILTLSTTYYLIFLFVKKSLRNNGKIQTRENLNKYSAMTESFHGIKEIKQMGIEEFYYKKYFNASWKAAHAYAFNNLIALSPKFALEVMAFGGITTFIIFLLKNTTSIEIFLSTLSLFAITGYKLLPAVQMVFSSISTFKGNINAFHSIKYDLINSIEYTKSFKFSREQIFPKDEIILSNITFAYPNKDNPALKNVSLNIKPNTTVGFVGISGSGKTTTADIILGILSTKEGEISYDKIKVNDSNYE